MTRDCDVRDMCAMNAMWHRHDLTCDKSASPVRLAVADTAKPGKYDIEVLLQDGGGRSLASAFKSIAYGTTPAVVQVCVCVCVCMCV